MNDKQKDFYQSVDNLTAPLLNLLYDYEKLDSISNEETSINYPFRSSYDEWFLEFINWKNTLYDRWFSGVSHHSPTITVGELKNIIDDLPDSTQITVQSKDWWLNITECQKPDNDGMFTLNFTTSDTFNPSQL